MDELQWTVVQFLSNKNNETSEKFEISVIPMKWLVEIHGRLNSVWPPNKERKHIRNVSLPKEDWVKYPVENLLDSPVTYKDALAQEKKIVESASEDEAQDARKKKPAIYPDFVEMDTDSDDTRSFTSMELMPPPPPPPYSARVNEVESQMEEAPKNTAEDIIVEDNLIEDSRNQMESKMDAILKQTIENRILLERIINNLPNTNCFREFLPLSGNELLPKPFKKYIKLLEFEKKLAECKESRTQLETIFVRCGGVSEKDNIIRCMKKIFTDKLAKKCSWLGRKNNFPVSELITIKILKAAVTKNFPSLRDKNYEKFVANWLRQAMLRYIRSQNK